MRNKTITAAFIILTALVITGCSKTSERDLMFFFFESCPSCEEYQLAEKYAEKLIQLNSSKQWKALSRNLINPESAKELKAVLEEKELPDISRSLPLLIIENEYINGYEAIGLKLDELLTAKD